MNIIKTTKNYVKKIIGKESFEFINHAKNYMTATFFTKAIGFISVPIFTRLMTPEEYGVLAIFTSLIAISTILMGLNFHGSVMRYYHEEEKNFGEFISSNILFLFLFNIFSIYFINLFKYKIASFIGVELRVLIIAVAVSVFNIPIKILLAYLQSSKQSMKYSVISVSKSIIMIIISVIWVYLLNDRRYLGRMYGQLTIYAILFFLTIIYFVKLGKPKFKKKYVKYSLIYSIPLMPHALSGFILSYFDRIAINQLTGSLNTGLYSFAYNVGMIMNVVVMAMNKAWVPIFYEKLKNSDYIIINKMASNYAKYIFLAAASLILFSKELVMILADKEYYSALELLPIIILSYVFVFLYTIFANYSFYKKKTGLISLATLLAGIINIGLNYWLIPEFGYIAAAYTTLFSYVLLFIFHYINAKFIMKKNIINFKNIFLDLLMVLVLLFVYLILFSVLSNFLILFFVKIVIMSFIFFFLFKF